MTVGLIAATIFSIPERAFGDLKEVSCSQADVAHYIPITGSIEFTNINAVRKYTISFQWAHTQFPLWFKASEFATVEFDVAFYNYGPAKFEHSDCIADATSAFAQRVQWIKGADELGSYVDDPFDDIPEEPQATIGLQFPWLVKPDMRYEISAILAPGHGEQSHAKLTIQRGRLASKHIYCVLRGGKDPSHCVFPCTIGEEERTAGRLIEFCEMVAPGCRTWMFTGTATGDRSFVGSCDVQPELCDGEDDDRDGATDEGDSGERLTRACATACGSGIETCNDAGTGYEGCTAPSPTSEVCDGLDNNCDGTADEGCDCAVGDRRACGLTGGICKEGTQTCADGKWSACAGGVDPKPAELCNGLDDNCDGILPSDENDSDHDGYLICENDCDDANMAFYPGIWPRQRR